MVATKSFRSHALRIHRRRRHPPRKKLFQAASVPCHCFGSKKSWLGWSKTRDRTSPRGDAWRRRRSSSGGRVPALAGPLRPLRRLRLRRSRRRRLRPHGTGPPPRPRRTRRYPRSSRLAPVRDLGAARVDCSIRSLVPSGPGDLDGFTLAWGDRALVCDASHCSSLPPSVRS